MTNEEKRKEHQSFKDRYKNGMRIGSVYDDISDDMYSKKQFEFQKEETTMRNLCDTCKKSDICKYRDIYQEKFKAIEDLDAKIISSTKINDVLRISLECKYEEKSSQHMPLFRGLGGNK